MLKQKPHTYLLLLTSLGLYIALAYHIQRHETFPLIICYFFLFLLYGWIAYRQSETTFWIAVGILFRAALLFSVPALSDDFYRFIWDGRLMAAGYHPFSEVPEYYMTHHVSIPGIDHTLYDHLNAKNTFTVYPPVAQLVYWLAVKVSPDSIYGSMLAMKMIIFSFEVATLLLIRKLLLHVNLPPQNILLYALNPLVILELTGNLHFEGIMIFFLLLALWSLLHEKRLVSTIFYALSICTKLIPLMFLPLLSGQLGWKKGNQYWLMTAGFTALFFLPLFTWDFLSGFSESLGYYFQRFEFNASIYYLVRAAGYFMFGFNIIYIAGWALGVIATILILTISYRMTRNNAHDHADTRFFIGMLWCLVIYFAFTTILHPWYIVTLIIVSIFTRYRFPIIWSALIFMTYAGYTTESFNENLSLVALEYVIVTGYMLYETVWTSRLNHS